MRRAGGPLSPRDWGKAGATNNPFVCHACFVGTTISSAPSSPPVQPTLSAGLRTTPATADSAPALPQSQADAGPEPGTGKHTPAVATSASTDAPRSKVT